MTRAEAWTQFAAAAVVGGDLVAADAATQADAILVEYDKRFLDSPALLDQLKPLVADPTDDPITVVQKVLDACKKAKQPLTPAVNPKP